MSLNYARSLCILLLCLTAGHYARGQGFVIGANPDGFADYSVQSAYQNLAHYFRPYQSAVDSMGYPIGSSSTVTYANGYDDGAYRVEYDGPGDLSFSMGATSYSFARNGTHVVGTLQLRHDTPNYGGILTMSNTAAFSNLQITRPEATSDPSGIFSQKWINATNPWAKFRFMDWQQTNGSTLSSWADRAKPSDLLRTTGKGVPVEEMIQLSNVHGVDGWFNIPHQANLDWVTQEATLIKSQLKPGLKADMEFSNELWNFSFTQAADNLNAAKASNRYSKSDDFGRAAQRAADKAGEYYNEWKRVLGDKSGNLKLGGLVANQYWNQTALQWIKDKYPDLLSKTDIVVAPYIPGNISDIGGEKNTPEAYVDASKAFERGSITQWLTETKATADSFGVGADTYEVSVLGGLTGQTNIDLKAKAQRVEGAGILTQEAVDLLREKGFKSFNQFGIVTPWSEFGYWGPTNDINQLNGPRWDALVANTPEPGILVIGLGLLLRRRR
jgi:hypothetical protein